MTNSTTTAITTGNINKQNWSGEEAEVHGDYDAAANAITFELGGYQWRLEFQTWAQLENREPHPDDDCPIIGRGAWALTCDGSKDRSATVEAGESTYTGNREYAWTDHSPEHVLTSAARWIWNHV